jgi:hypothetical protein
VRFLVREDAFEPVRFAPPFAVFFRRVVFVRPRDALLLRAGLLRPVLLRVVLFRAVLLRGVLFRVLLFRPRAELVRDRAVREDDFRPDAFFRRDWPDSDMAIATAWRRLFTLRPERPLRSWPSLYSCMTFLTLRRCCFLAISASEWKLRSNPATAERDVRSRWGSREPNWRVRVR